MTTVFTSLKTLHYLKYPSVFENFYFEKKTQTLPFRVTTVQDLSVDHYYNKKYELTLRKKKLPKGVIP